MVVTSSKLTTIPFKGYDGVDLAVNIKTSNQSIKKQRILWSLHGSGGVSSNDELWHIAALSRGYCIAWIDHYTPRGIYKLNHTKNSTENLWSIDMAEDVMLAKDCIDQNKHLLPYANLSNVKLVGFSSGGTAAMYVTTWSENLDWIHSVAALYPGIWPLTDRILDIAGHKIQIYVGEEDDWTPFKHALTLQSLVPALGVNIWPNTKHSFSKPGSGGYYQDIVNTSDIPYPIPIPLSDVKMRSGDYARCLDQWYGRRLGVHAEYSHTSTSRTIDHFLGVNLTTYTD
jgi:predicted esterase